MKYLGTVIRLVFLALCLFLIANGKMMLWLAIFGVSLIAATFVGRVYCGYACPMNTLMVPTEWISKKLKLQTNKSPKWFQTGKLSWVALVISIISVLVLKKTRDISFPVMSVWLGISVLVTLRYKPFVFHNIICPFGALQKTFGRFAKYSKTIDKERCIGCKLCEKVCPTEAIIVSSKEKKADINVALCLQCTNCQQVCPKDVIHYSNSGK